MKTSLKILILAGVFGLSGCAFTNDVLQHAYDEQARSDCSKAHTSNPNSIHRPSNCRSINSGAYKPNSATKDKKDGK